MHTILRKISTMIPALFLLVGVCIAPGPAVALEDAEPFTPAPNLTPGEDDEVLILTVREFNDFLATGMLPGDPEGQPSGDPDKKQQPGGTPGQDVEIIVHDQ